MSFPDLDFNLNDFATTTYLKEVQKYKALYCMHMLLDLATFHDGKLNPACLRCHSTLSSIFFPYINIVLLRCLHSLNT